MKLIPPQRCSYLLASARQALHLLKMCFTLFEKNHNHHSAIVYFLHFVIHSGVWVQAASTTVQMMSNLTPLSRSENLRHHQVKNWFYPFKLMGKGLLWGCMNVPPKITLALLPHTFVELQLCLVPRKCSTPRSSSRYKLCYCQLAFEAPNLRSLYLFCSVLCLSEIP